jgi:hypothetical protein
MDKSSFSNWNDKQLKWKQKRVQYVKFLENIPPIQRKKYFEKFKDFDRKYQTYFQLCNDLYSMEESIENFYRKNNQESAKEMKIEQEELIQLIGEVSQDFLFIQQDMDHITYKFDIADHLNKIRIKFSKNFYFDINSE